MSLFQDNPDKVGIIGLGIIGSRAAEVLRNAGYHVYVWNRSPKPEPNFVASPGEIAQLTERIQIFVTDGKALIEVIEQLEDQLTNKHLIISSATVDPESSKKAAEAVESKGAAYLEAPFTGSRLAAEKGALVYYAGGEPKVLERARAILETTAKEILYIGAVGEAAVIKIATNMISATTVEVLAEAFALTKASGIDPDRLAEAMDHNGSGSALTAMKLPSMITEDYDPHFSLQNMFKDAQFALNLANRHRIDVPALSTTASVMFKSIQKGWGDEDYSVLARNFQDGAKKKGSAKKKA